MTQVSHQVGEEMGIAMTGAPAWIRRLGRDSAYALTSLPLAVPAVVLVTILVAVGLGLLVILVGLPILALGILTARGFAHLERRRLGRLTATAMVHPVYLTAEAGDGIVRRLFRPAGDRQSWLDVVWVLVAVLTSTISWSIAVAWWAAALGGPTYGLWGAARPARHRPGHTGLAPRPRHQRDRRHLGDQRHRRGGAADPAGGPARGCVAELHPGARPALRTGRAPAGSTPLRGRPSRRPGRRGRVVAPARTRHPRRPATTTGPAVHGSRPGPFTARPGPRAGARHHRRRPDPGP